MKLRGKKINEYVKDINVNDSVPKNKIIFKTIVCKIN